MKWQTQTQTINNYFKRLRSAEWRTPTQINAVYIKLISNIIVWEDKNLKVGKKYNMPTLIKKSRSSSINVR